MMTNKQRTIDQLNQVMSEMQYLVEHPRMKQRNWVAKGKAWLPVLQYAKEDLQQDSDEIADLKARIVTLEHRISQLETSND